MSKRKVHRDAATGAFTTAEDANARPAETVTETVSDEAASLRALLGAIHARLNRRAFDEAAVLAMLDEIESEIPELAPLRSDASSDA